MQLEGKVAAITGASTGLGLGIARAYVRAGADVLICSRKAAELDAARERILADGYPRRVVAVPADVASPAAVARFMDAAESAFGRLDVLVCNAGIFGAKGPIDAVDWDEWVGAIETNLLGTVQCVRAALPLLRRSPFRPKIAITAGGGSERAHPYLSAYGASKAGLVRFAECLALQLADEMDVNSFLPGRLATRMVDEVLAAGPERVGRYYYEDFVTLRQTGGASLENAAELAVFLGSEESNGIFGRLIHAVRDDWRSLARHRSALAPTDVFTLRRVEPADRKLAL